MGWGQIVTIIKKTHINGINSVPVMNTKFPVFKGLMNAFKLTYCL